MLKINNSKYLCNFCENHAGDNLRVFCIKTTIWYEEMKQPNMINSCENCLKEQMKRIITGTDENLRFLREKIVKRVPDFGNQFIEKTDAVRILSKLVVNLPEKRPNDASHNGDRSSKRAKTELESSLESGNTTTLAPYRGTVIGGGMPGKKFVAKPLGSSQPSGDDSQSQHTPPALAFQHGQPGPLSPQNASTSENVSSHSQLEPQTQESARRTRARTRFSSPPPAEDSEEGSDSDEEMPPPRANVRPSGPARRAPRPSIECGTAPRQVPRQRQPQEDGFRMVGA